MMTVFGTPLSAGAKRVLLLGSGELGKEVVIELQRYGVETIAVDRYANAPAMQLAHRSHVIDMLAGAELRRVIELEQADLIVTEIRTEERRGGQECGRACRSWWSQDNSQKK